MKKINIIITGILLSFSPYIALARSCYVGDLDQESNYYKTINEAIDSNCQFITVSPGEYEENIVIKDGIKISSIANNKAVIKGLVKMTGESGLRDVVVINTKVRDSKKRTIGIKVEEDANVFLHGVEVANADIGVETSKDSTLTIVESKLFKNKKGFYIRYGTTIDVRNNEVINNEEEGVDVRAAISGKISGNRIVYNGESGIEIIMGGSNMKISNNIIKENHSSGIALQFYKESPELGDFLIAGNELIGNDNQGITCKRPSGGKTSQQYWAKSTRFEYNKVENNKKGLVFKGCKFNGPKKWEINKTKKEQEMLNEALVNLEKTSKVKSEKELVAIISSDNKYIDKISQEDDWKRQKIDSAKKKEIDKIVDEIEWSYDKTIEVDKELLENRSKLREFFLGPQGPELKNLKADLDSHNFAVEKTQKIADEIETEYIKVDALQQVAKIEQRKELQEIYNQYSGKFGIWPWIKGLF